MNDGAYEYDEVGKSGKLPFLEAELGRVIYAYELAHSRAREEGIPYQTLLSSVIHKYLSGRLTDNSAMGCSNVKPSVGCSLATLVYVRKISPCFPAASHCQASR